MHRRIRVAGIILLAAASSACSRDLVIEPDSCYDIEIAAWPAEAGYGADMLEVAPPPRVRLEGARPPGDTTPGVIAELPGVLPSVHSSATWQYAGPDSVRMIWSTGFGGVILRLGGSADSLTGSAKSFFDYQEGHTTGAVAMRVGCSAEIPEAARAVRRFHVGVPLASGDTLFVGGRLPANVNVDTTRTGRLEVREVPVGAFRGAESLAVESDNDLITFIVIEYRVSVRVRDLAVRLESILGPPSGSRSVRSIHGDPLEIVRWSDRFGSVMVWGPDDVRITIGTHRPPR